MKSTMEFSSNSFFIFFIFFFFSFVASNPSDSSFKTTYDHLCNDVVPASTTPPHAETSPDFAESLRILSGYFSGGDPIFNKSADENISNRFSFRVTSVRRTTTDGVHELQAKVTIKQENVGSIQDRSLVRVYPGARVSDWMRFKQRMKVSLSGFWSQSSGKICMFGIGTYGMKNMQNVNVVLMLRYPNNVTIFDSFISGTLESFDDDMKKKKKKKKNSLNHFEPVSILALSHSSNYNFTMIGKENENGNCVAGSNEESLNHRNLNLDACSVFLRRTDKFQLDYGSQCNNVSCNPLGGAVGVENLPAFTHFYSARCVERRKIQMLLAFPDSVYSGYYEFPFRPNTTLISEGVWDEKENRFCGVACRILNFTETPYVGDCSIKFTLWFPAVLSLRNRSTVLGRIWSDKHVGESGYFSSIGFEGSWIGSRGLTGLQYKYTEIDRVRKSCGEKVTARGKGKKYPDGYSSDTSFSVSVTNSKGQLAQGYSSPLFVGDQRYNGQLYGVPFVPTNGNLKAHSFQYNSLNVSYMIMFKSSPDFKFGSELSSTKIKIIAEGLYNRNTGVMCLVGCRDLRTNGKILLKNESLDCEIMVNIQFPPLNAKGGEFIKGTIESTRQKADPYYFDPLQLSSYSLYRNQVDASIWRMDFEIIMVLISNTLSCVFVGLQLLHVKKHTEVLPHISIVMLLVITLGHMIPLVLNFEALFKVNHNGVQNVFLGSGGWLEVNEVVVRMVTMVAFLLELRLLQLTWSSRQSEESQTGLWASEKWVLYMTLPLYFGGGLTAWFVHIWKNSRRKSSRPFHLSRHRFRFSRGHPYPLPSLWEDFKSYAGLLLDGFLLPQTLFNIVSNNEGKALASSFYFGTTIVRILPHAYDLYRAHSSAWYLNISSIYADHRMDFYSTAWDIIIPIGGLSFAVLIYLQQRFGSRCILPKRFRKTSAYEKVPVIGNDDL